MNKFFTLCFLIVAGSCTVKGKDGIKLNNMNKMFELELNASVEEEKRPTFKNAHPNAQKVMVEDFFWSEMDEYAPFGSDAGSDMFFFFQRCRKHNTTGSPVQILEYHIAGWRYPHINLGETDSNKIRLYITDVKSAMETINGMKGLVADEMKKESPTITDAQLEMIYSKTAAILGKSRLRDIDNAIVATGFAQYVLEGVIDKELKTLVRTALYREMLPMVLPSDPSEAKYRTEILKN